MVACAPGLALVWLLMTELATNHPDSGASRRTFVQLVAGGIGLAAASRSHARAPANDKIQVGFIGLGRQGTSRLNEFMKQPDVVAAAVCDLDGTHLDAAVAAVEKAQGHKPAQYHDFRKLLERKDLDAVMVATPDHWHALPAIHACQAGKDVFVEKPLAYSIGEGRAMVAAARARTYLWRSRWPIPSAKSAPWSPRRSSTSASPKWGTTSTTIARRTGAWWR